MAKKCQKLPMLAFFAIFMSLSGSKTLQKHVFSCRAGSKLRFGGSYAKIGEELASGMSF